MHAQLGGGAVNRSFGQECLQCWQELGLLRFIKCAQATGHPVVQSAKSWIVNQPRSVVEHEDVAVCGETAWSTCAVAELQCTECLAYGLVESGAAGVRRASAPRDGSDVGSYPLVPRFNETSRVCAGDRLARNQADNATGFIAQCA